MHQNLCWEDTAMGRLAWTLALLVVIGCGPSFRDEAAEFESLQAVANPTPAQFLRRKELGEGAGLKAAEAESRVPAPVAAAMAYPFRPAASSACQNRWCCATHVSYSSSPMSPRHSTTERMIRR